MYIYAVIIIHIGRFRFLSSMCRLSRTYPFADTVKGTAISLQLYDPLHCRPVLSWRITWRMQIRV